MRVNVYSQELTGDIERVTKLGTDKAGMPAQFHAIRLYLHSAQELHHTPEDDDRSAVTIWLPRSLARRVDLAIALRAMAAWAEGSWPGGWDGWQDGPYSLRVKAEREHAAEDRERPELAAQVEGHPDPAAVVTGRPPEAEGQQGTWADRAERWARGGSESVN